MKSTRSGTGSLKKMLSGFLNGVLYVHLIKINKVQLL
jgi:hypothetical protein